MKKLTLVLVCIVLLSFNSNAYQTRIDSLKDELLVSKLDKDKFELLNQLCFQYRFRDIKKAIEYAQRMEEIGLSLSDDTYLTKAYFQRGIAEAIGGNYTLASKYFLKSITINEQLKDSVSLAKCYHSLGNIFNETGKNREALDYYNRSLRIYESQKDSSGMQFEYNCIGLLYTKDGNSKLAIQYFNKRLAIAESLKRSKDIGATFNNIGEVYLKSKDYLKALNYYNKSLTIRRENRDEKGEGLVLGNIGDTYRKMRNYSSAISYYNEAIDIRKKIDDQLGVARLQLRLSKLHIELNEYSKAGVLCKESIAILKLVGSKEYLVEALLELVNIYYKNSEYKKAIDVHREYVAEKDMLLNIESARQIKLLQLQHETDKKDSEIGLLRKERIVQSRMNIYLSVASITVFIMLVLLFFYFKLKIRFYKQNQELMLHKDLLKEKQIETQERKIASAAILIDHKNQTLNEINQQLRSVPPDDEYITKVAGIKKTISNSINTDNGWMKWKFHFEKVHPGFFFELDKLFPNLSQNEIRFCAYVKLNLSTKEIAQLSGIGVKAVQMYKYRLKKKFNLDRSVNFDQYLYTINQHVASTEHLHIGEK